MPDAVDRPARLARVVALVLAVVGGLVLVVGVVTDRPEPLNATTLVGVLEDEVGSASPVDDGHCAASDPDHWTCSVADQEGSGSATYDVRRTSRYCFHATIRSADAKASMPRTAAGCTS
ncbi:MAG TPA: hypothetical protein VI318_25990 [Baekduia sp.]